MKYIKKYKQIKGNGMNETVTKKKKSKKLNFINKKKKQNKTKYSLK